MAWRHFGAASDGALAEKVEFGYSGYAIGNYLDAQEQVNSAPNRHERTKAALALSRAFTAAFPFEEKENFAEFPPDKLLAWCRKEYANDAGQHGRAITAAHAFYQEGLAKITPESVVVLLIVRTRAATPGGMYITKCRARTVGDTQAKAFRLEARRYERC